MIPSTTRATPERISKTHHSGWWRCALVATVLLGSSAVLSGCTNRYLLGKSELVKANEDGALDRLGVYVSHRTIPVYERDEGNETVVGREIRDRSRRGRLRRPISRNDTGLIIDHDLRNGALRLWVSFSRTCRDIDCAYGFVQTPDGRFRLVDVPDREDYDKKSIYRSCVIGRHELEHGKIQALSDPNPVYRLSRKRKDRPRTVILEIKRSQRKRTRDKVDPETGN